MSVNSAVSNETTASFESSPTWRSLSWLSSDPLAAINAEKLNRLTRGAPVSDLSMINPDLAPARVLLDKLLEATVRPTNHRYAVSRGVRKLREAFAAKYQSAWGVTLNPETELCATMGSKDALEQTLRCVASRGSVVLVADPVYPAFLSAIRMVEARVVPFSLGSSEQETLAAIRARAAEFPGAVLLLNFPHNPTGTTVGASFWEEVAEIAQQFDLFVVNDFVYGEMVHPGFAPNGFAASALGCAAGRERFAESYSLSKAYNVPGWRVGAVAGPSWFIKRLAQLKSHIDYGIFLPLQIAASAALTSEPTVVASTTGRYHERAQILGMALQRRGWKVTVPQAGASLWAELPSQYQGSAMEFALRCVVEEGVVVLPGELFSCESSELQGMPHSRQVRFALVVAEKLLGDIAERVQRVVLSEDAGRRGEMAL